MEGPKNTKTVPDTFVLTPLFHILGACAARSPDRSQVAGLPGCRDGQEHCWWASCDGVLCLHAMKNPPGTVALNEQ